MIKKIIEELDRKFGSLACYDGKGKNYVLLRDTNAGIEIEEFFKTKLQEMYEEGVCDIKKLRCVDCKDYMKYLTSEDSIWNSIEEHVIKAEMAWDKLLNRKIKETKKNLIKEIEDWGKESRKLNDEDIEEIKLIIK